MSYMEELLFEALQRGNLLDEDNARLSKENKALKKKVRELETLLDHRQKHIMEDNIRARLMDNCSTCDEKRWIWETCGEGTCQMAEPCKACNSDGLLPMNWDTVAPRTYDS